MLYDLLLQALAKSGACNAAVALKNFIKLRSKISNNILVLTWRIKTFAYNL